MDVRRRQWVTEMIASRVFFNRSSAEIVPPLGRLMEPESLWKSSASPSFNLPTSLGAEKVPQCLCRRIPMTRSTLNIGTVSPTQFDRRPSTSPCLSLLLSLSLSPDGAAVGEG